MVHSVRNASRESETNHSVSHNAHANGTGSRKEILLHKRTNANVIMTPSDSMFFRGLNSPRQTGGTAHFAVFTKHTKPAAAITGEILLVCEPIQCASCVN